jgi:hypothetical protein
LGVVARVALTVGLDKAPLSLPMRLSKKIGSPLGLVGREIAQNAS